MDEKLVACIERSQFYTLPRHPQDCVWYAEPGVEGRQTRISHRTANGLLCTRLEPSTVNQAIATTQARFQGQEFGWVVTPLSEPHDLAARLVHHGYARSVTCSAMVLGDLSHIPTANERVQVRQADSAQLEHVTDVNARAFGLPLESARVIARCHLETRDLESRTYLAWLPGIEAPQGVGVMVSVPGTQLVLLASAATDAAHRGKGIYGALMAQRLRDARAAGATGAIIHAVSHTSAPICARWDFRELCQFELYTLPH
jgi:GNAT superfamily N-acetyltransferase